MLRYFIARKSLTDIKTPHATPISLRSANEYKGLVIPFSHIYVTSDPYSRRIKKALGDDLAPAFEEFNKNQTAAIHKHARFPVDFKSIEFSSINEIHNWLNEKIKHNNTINIVVVNGIGSAFGDNLIGLGAIQRLRNLLAPYDVRFHLMQSMNERAKPVYMYEDNVLMTNNCMPMNNFLSMDLLINLTGMLGFPDFDELPLAHFYAKTFSISKLLQKNNIHPKLHLDKSKVNAFCFSIKQKFNNDRPIVLLHPQASSPVRTMPESKALKISKQLINSGFNVICAIKNKINLKSPYFHDVSHLSRSIDDLKHIIVACDGVISVGTVVYHISAALSKPTLLLPTVKADVESAKLIPEVLTWLPKKNESLILNLHKSRHEKDLNIAKKIWRQVNEKKLVLEFKSHIDSFEKAEHRVIAPGSKRLVGIVIPHFGEQEKLTRCLDSLLKIDGFDPAYLYVINNNKHNRYFTVAVNEGIKNALDDGCEYVWVLNNDTKVDQNYLNATLKRFTENEKIGIIGGKNLKTENLDRIFWGGSYNAFPQGQHKAGYVSRDDLNTPTRETWATFSSVVIKAQTYLDVGGLDNSMRMIFSDSDFCFSAAQKGWQTWYEPESIVTHDTGVSAKGGNDDLKKIFRKDKIAFYNKWKSITGCDDPEKLQEAIFKEVSS